jgi:hypothetical protein
MRQRSQVGSSTTIFLKRLGLHWSLPMHEQPSKELHPPWCTGAPEAPRTRIGWVVSAGLDHLVQSGCVRSTINDYYSSRHVELCPSLLLFVNTTRQRSSLTSASSHAASTATEEQDCSAGLLREPG